MIIIGQGRLRYSGGYGYVWFRKRGTYGGVGTALVAVPYLRCGDGGGGKAGEGGLE